jgi:hypothetical protein
MQHWNDKKMLPLFFMLLFMMAYKDLDMDESEFFNFLFFPFIQPLNVVYYLIISFSSLMQLMLLAKLPLFEE